MRGRLKFIALAIGLVVVALTAALLAGSGEEGDPLGAIAEAADRTTKAQALRFEEHGKLAMPDLGIVSDYTGHGEMDMRGERSVAHGDYTALYDAFRKKAAAEGVEPSELGRREEWQMDAVFDGSTIYIKFPMMVKNPGGKPWRKFDIEGAARAAGVDPTVIEESMGADDPTQMLRYLRVASDDVKEVGTEQLRGEEATHYEATVNLRKYVDLVSPKQRAAARRTMDKFIENYGTDKIHTEVWIGEDKLVRRIETKETSDMDGEELTLSSFQDFYALDRPARIELPPASQVHAPYE
jgi:hypothetical protein